ncbi:hypothetical protein PG994_000710 [Apiospora phragmitis]|uniref:SNF2 N-terminal domain-containing protein n=1 Tax=Apiospora phragmitis TaxID=2905665 RepID=A0ABR1X702_9PEZI
MLEDDSPETGHQSSASVDMKDVKQEDESLFVPQPAFPEPDQAQIEPQSGSNATSFEVPEQDEDAQKTDELEYLTEDLRDYTIKRDRLETQLRNRAGTVVEKMRLQQLNERMKDIRAQIQQIQSSTQWWEKKFESEKDKIARERNRLYHIPLPANTSQKRRRALKPADKGHKRTFRTQRTDQMFEARAALQDLPEAGEVSATTKDQQLRETITNASKHGDAKSLNQDVRQLEHSSRPFGLYNCKPDNANWALAKFIVKGLNTRLLAHQVINVSRMLSREFGQDRGGINADEMGLGKTIQTFDCVPTTRPDQMIQRRH